MALYEVTVSGGGLRLPLQLRLLSRSEAVDAARELERRGFTVERVPHGYRVERNAAQAVESALLMADRGDEVAGSIPVT